MSKTGLDGMRVRIAAIGPSSTTARTGWRLAWPPSPPLLGTEPDIKVVAKAGDGCYALPQTLNLLQVVVDGPRGLGEPEPPRAVSNVDPSGAPARAGPSSPTRSPSGAAASPP